MMNEQKGSCGCGCIPMHKVEQKSSCGCGCDLSVQKDAKAADTDKTMKEETKKKS